MSTALVESTRQFRAFADPTRLRILNLLLERELCVCHLVEVLDEPQPKVSRHLGMLRAAGLVTVRVEGAWRHYALPEEPRGLAARLLRCVGEGLGGVEVLQADRQRLADVAVEGTCAGTGRGKARARETGTTTTITDHEKRRGALPGARVPRTSMAPTRRDREDRDAPTSARGSP